ncbi:MAG: hypothetical protein U9P50_01220 [Patescibacteria group bacterium]|nr:hypothetical protein [Patescibacteria group bacterium]
MKNIIILVDDRGFFYSSIRERGSSMNVEKIKKNLEKLGYLVSIKGFYEINFNDSYKNKIVLYQSTEDPDLRYKNYIEDVLLGLQNLGVILIPGLNEFRAHHNKVFMEVLRDVKGLNKKTNIYTKKYGTLDEFVSDTKGHIFPMVIKPSLGSRSKNIYRVDNLGEAIKKIKKISKTFTLVNLKRAFQSIIDGKGYKKISNFRNKFIVQNYIFGLKGDYKILVYGDKFYVLERKNRKRDFRASGSGLFSFPETLPEGLLDYSLEMFNEFKVPFISMDIAVKDSSFYLIEFQFVSFGQLTLEKSDFYFKKSDSWQKIDSKSDLEETFVDSVDKYINLYIK